MHEAGLVCGGEGLRDLCADLDGAGHRQRTCREQGTEGVAVDVLGLLVRPFRSVALDTVRAARMAGPPLACREDFDYTVCS